MVKAVAALTMMVSGFISKSFFVRVGLEDGDAGFVDGEGVTLLMLRLLDGVDAAFVLGDFKIKVGSGND